MSSQALSSGSRSHLTTPSLGDLTEKGSEIQQEGLAGEDEEEEGREGVAVARPPRSSAASAEVAISGQAALDALEQLVASGAVGRERASRLRSKYLLLKETLENSRAVESSLLTEAKQLGQHLTQQQRVLERGASFPDRDSSEPSQLRQVVLQHQNQLQLSSQRMSKLQDQVDRLEEEKEQLEKDFSRLPRKEEMEEVIKNKTRQLEELKDEIAMRSRDAQRYREDMESRQHKISSIQEEMEELKQIENSLQEELIQIRSAPGNLPREIDSLHKKKSDIRQKMKDYDIHLVDLEAQASELSKHCEEVKGQRVEEAVALKERRVEGGRLEVQLGQLERALAEAKGREASLQEDRASLELQLRHRAADQQALFELHASHTKGRDREAKQVKKADLQLKAVQQAELQVQRRHDQMLGRVEGGRTTLEGQRSIMVGVREDVEQLRRGLGLQEGLTAGHQAVLEGRQGEEEQARERVRAASAKLQELNKEVIAKTRMRDRESRDCHTTKSKEHELQATLLTKEAERREQRKRVRQLEQQLREFVAAYKVVKTERNHTYSQIQTLQQLAAELREKWKILQNEAEVLRTSADEKEKLLQKCLLVESAMTMERESQRQELSQVQQSLAGTQDSLDQQREVLSKLTQEISKLEQQLTQLQRHYEQALQERNDAGLQLIERNEEVCVFHEKLNMQEAVLRQANLDLMARKEEIRYLRMEMSRVNHSISIARKANSEKTRLQVELDMAQIELCQCGELLRGLEQAVEDAGKSSRLRLLAGPAPEQEQLRGRLEVLEEQVGKQEQQQLEKELLYEQICKLTDRAQDRADSQKESTLQVAQRVNQFQSKIKETTRKTMAIVSELSMNQATALRLQQQVREDEATLETAYSRLQAGQPPDQETAEQWRRLVREEEQRRVAWLRGKLEEDGGEVTTAEPRPTAYLPQAEGELPVPKPYGQHAPFKPTQPGANMRHIRKPEPKPIDI